MNNNIKSTARVSCVQKNLFKVLHQNNSGEYEEINAKLKGKFYNLKLEQPVVGDYVTIISNDYGDSLIEEILPRKTAYKRPNRSGHKEGFIKNLLEETIVSNFEYVFIVTSLNQDYSENRIARYVSIALQTGANPVIVLSKADLCDDVELQVEITKAICPKADVVAISSKTGFGIENLKRYLIPEITIAIVGSSGVGKSTLLNTLNGSELMKVNEIRDADGKGRHTTTYRELFKLSSGTWIMDTPGLREIGVLDMEDGIEETFSDITSLFGQCKFNNCSHTQEPGCAVLKAIDEGKLETDRWEMYCKLHAENEWGKRKRISIARQTKLLQNSRQSFWIENDK